MPFKLLWKRSQSHLWPAWLVNICLTSTVSSPFPAVYISDFLLLRYFVWVIYFREKENFAQLKEPHIQTFINIICIGQGAANHFLDTEQPTATFHIRRRRVGVLANEQQKRAGARDSNESNGWRWKFVRGRGCRVRNGLAVSALHRIRTQAARSWKAELFHPALTGLRSW